jgi:hypothetical protein
VNIPWFEPPNNYRSFNRSGAEQQEKSSNEGDVARKTPASRSRALGETQDNSPPAKTSLNDSKCISRVSHCQGNSKDFRDRNSQEDGWQYSDLRIWQKQRITKNRARYASIVAPRSSMDFKNVTATLEYSFDGRLYLFSERSLAKGARSAQENASAHGGVAYVIR